MRRPACGPAAAPFEDASFDAAVCSLVLCSVPRQASALAELRRVLRRGGELRFFEHVRSPTPQGAPPRRARSLPHLAEARGRLPLCARHPRRDPGTRLSDPTRPQRRCRPALGNRQPAPARPGTRGLVVPPRAPAAQLATGAGATATWSSCSRGIPERRVSSARWKTVTRCASRMILGVVDNRDTRSSSCVVRGTSPQ